MNQTDMLYRLAYDLAQSRLHGLSVEDRRELTRVNLAHWSDGGSAGKAPTYPPLRCGRQPEAISSATAPTIRECSSSIVR